MQAVSPTRDQTSGSNVGCTLSFPYVQLVFPGLPSAVSDISSRYDFQFIRDSIERGRIATQLLGQFGCKGVLGSFDISLPAGIQSIAHIEGGDGR